MSEPAMNLETDPELLELERLRVLRASEVATAGVPTSRDAFDAWSSKPMAVLSDEDLAREEKRARGVEASAVRRRLPAAFAETQLGDLVPRIREKSLSDPARAWDPRRHGNVLLLGETGVGKSSAAAVLFLRLLRQGWREGGAAWELARGMQWFRVEQLERTMREFPLGKGECPEYAAAHAASVLFLDDLGWERDPKATGAILAERYDAPGLTVITSGLTKSELTERYGAAVVRRMLTHRQRPPLIAEAWPSAKPKERPPSDQGELARRLGERD